MKLTHILLLLILITVLGAWPFVGWFILIIIIIVALSLSWNSLSGRVKKIAEQPATSNAVPIWFEGNEEAWNGFLDWNVAFIQKICDGQTKKLISKKIPSWFADKDNWLFKDIDKERWIALQEWQRDRIRYICEIKPEEKSLKTDTSKRPSWFGDERGWEQFMKWNDAFIREVSNKDKKLTPFQIIIGIIIVLALIVLLANT